MIINFFEHQKKIAKNLVAFIRLHGYSKRSLSILTGISRPTIDQIIKGESPNQTTFNTQISKINETFQLPADYLITVQVIPVQSPPLAYAYSDYGDIDNNRSDKAINLLEGLDNILDIYSIYV
ncbi:helix-turn-helix transcriptional regulator [Paenibacillus sp. FSL H8-0537]|uniref:helix-turn-helix domain-containing protein n=1 Tax=Paenibacillus sp. FSL H8-0537 TaxID=2921399 RepID=UPI003100E3E3